MNSPDFKQIFGGLGVTCLVLFALIIASEFKELKLSATNLSKSIAQPQFNSTPIQLSPNSSFISGSFNPQSSVNFVQSDPFEPNTQYYYTAIFNERLKNKETKPQLKLEVEDMGTISWKNVPWKWIDYNQGILYFHSKTLKDNEIIDTQNYTGNYQLLF